MVKLDLKYGLPFCSVNLCYNGKGISIDKVLLDTGSGGSVFKRKWFKRLKDVNGWQKKIHKKAFDNFEAEKIVKYTEEKLEQLMEYKGIVRNRRKIESVVTNAKAFLEIQKQYGSFSNYIWKFVDNKPITNYWKGIKEVPASNELSDKMSKRLNLRLKLE